MAKRGPIFYEVIKAHRSGAPSTSAFEFPLFTDAQMVGQIAIRPLEFINPVAGIARTGYFRPAIIVYVETPTVDMGEHEPMTDTDTTAYHGGSALEEIAALASLCLGIRLKAGAVSRTFGGGNARGTPVAWELEPWPHSREVSRSLLFPFAAGEHLMDEGTLGRLGRIGDMAPKEARVLIKAARAYQEALWIGEWEPERAWLLFVGAIEAVDNFGAKSSATDAELLERYNPEIANPLKEMGSKELLEALAPQMRVLFASTRKFCDFIQAYFPPPPLRRPPPGFQINWTPDEIDAVMRIIYRCRSQALHVGTPFPLPMCGSPFINIGWEAPSEGPLGLAMRSRQGTWRREDTPIMLHIFEHIVRHVLLNWWDSRLTV